MSETGSMPPGVESCLLELVPEQPLRVRAKFRLLPAPSAGEQPAHADVDVTLSARVFDLVEVESRNSLPDPRAEGPQVSALARSEWSVIELELPSLPYARYAVQAKALSRDARYPSLEPSSCYVGLLTFGYGVRIPLDLLGTIYAGATGNPVGEAEIKRLVSTGAVVVVDESGRVRRVRGNEKAFQLVD